MTCYKWVRVGQHDVKVMKGPFARFRANLRYTAWCRLMCPETPLIRVWEYNASAHRGFDGADGCNELNGD